MKKNPPTIDRREFFGAVGSAAAVIALGDLHAKKIGRIGLQLYTVRDQMKSDFFGTLAKVARIGYKEVEFAGYFGNDARAVRAALKKKKRSHVAIVPYRIPCAWPSLGQDH